MSATSKRNRALEAGEEPVTGKEMMDHMNTVIPPEEPSDDSSSEENENVG